MSEGEKKEYMGLDYEATVSEEGILHVPTILIKKWNTARMLIPTMCPSPVAISSFVPRIVTLRILGY